MANWCEIAKENLRAGQVLADAGLYRSAVSRCYYAAFSAVTFILRDVAPFGKGRETPAHQQVTHLLEESLHGIYGDPKVRDIKARVRRLYSQRLSADYRSRLNIGMGDALQARQDAHSICRQLGVL